MTFKRGRMKKKIYCTCDREETIEIEVPDDATEEQLETYAQEAYEVWLSNFIEGYWEWKE